MWCTDQGFSVETAGGSGFWVENGKNTCSGLTFTEGSHETPNDLSKRLQSVYDKELLKDFEMTQSILRAIKLLGETEASDLSSADAAQKPVLGDRSEQDTERSPSTVIDNDRSKMKQESATSLDPLKEEILSKFENKAIWFTDEWKGHHRRLKIQVEASASVISLLSRKRWDVQKLHRFIRCAYECNARAEDEIPWNEVVDYVMAKEPA